MLSAHLPRKISTTAHHPRRVFHSNSTRRALLAARSTVARAPALTATSAHKEPSTHKDLQATAGTSSLPVAGGRHLGQVALRGNHLC